MCKGSEKSISIAYPGCWKVWKRASQSIYSGKMRRQMRKCAQPEGFLVMREVRENKSWRCNPMLLFKLNIMHFTLQIFHERPLEESQSHSLQVDFFFCNFPPCPSSSTSLWKLTNSGLTLNFLSFKNLF